MKRFVIYTSSSLWFHYFISNECTELTFKIPTYTAQADTKAYCVHKPKR